MFANKGSGSKSFGIFWLVILLELLICGDRTVLGGHLRRHPHSRRLHRQSIYPSVPAAENIESNDLPEYEKLEKADSVFFDDTGVPEVPEIRHIQAQPADFVFLDDAHDPVPIEHQGANGRFTYIEDNGLDPDKPVEKEDEKNSANDPAVPDSIGSRNIIKAPLKDCAVGERRDSEGRCRLVVALK